MSATDVFLFSLSFLVSGLLAGWVRRLGRDRDRSSAFPLRKDPGGELDRLTESLASALNRIEAMERRHEELVRELESRTGTNPDPAGMSTGAEGGPSSPDAAVGAGAGHDADEPLRGTDADAPRAPGRRSDDPGPGSDWEGSDLEVSPSQWRSAMDRLGPVWRSGPRLTDPGRRTSSFERGDITEGRDPEPAPPSSRRGAPLDNLFPPPASLGELPRFREAGRRRTGPEAGAR